MIKSTWVNVREQAATGSPILSRLTQNTTLSLLNVQVSGTAVRGQAAHGGWLSIVGSEGLELLERIGDLDVQTLAGGYRMRQQGSAPIFSQPDQHSVQVNKMHGGQEFDCAKIHLASDGSMYCQLAPHSSSWVLVFSPSHGLLAEQKVKGYNYKEPRVPIRDQFGHQMMLPSDMVLAWDPEFRKTLKIYNTDENALKEQFGAAFKRLTELGCPWSQYRVLV